MMKVLALDPAQNCGWAIGSPSQPGGCVLSGAKWLRPPRPTFAPFVDDLIEWLDAMLVTHQPTHVVYEAPYANVRNLDVPVLRRLFSMGPIIEWCAVKRWAEPFEAAPDEWRAVFLGKGGARGKRADLKEAVMTMCRRHGWAPQTDDIGDALGILDFACRKLDRNYQSWSDMKMWSPAQ